jgi:uncharacterized protein YjbJ (UPF0337 family)
MNADQLEGKWMQFKGELKQQWGKFADDDVQEIEGFFDKFVGKVQEQYGDKNDQLMKWEAQWHQQSAPQTTKDKGALTGSHQEDGDGSQRNFTFQLRRRS